MNQPDEKRDYFRVAETLSIHLVALAPDTDRSRPASEWFPALAAPPWLEEFRALNRELQREIATLASDQASAIKLLTRQNELLAGALMKNQVPAEMTLKDLSEGGLSVDTALPLSPGQTLALALLLNISPLPLFCYGEVLRITDGDASHGQLPRVAVGFVDINRSDRDLIARQVLQSQRKRGV